MSGTPLEVAEELERKKESWTYVASGPDFVVEMLSM